MPGSFSGMGKLVGFAVLGGFCSIAAFGAVLAVASYLAGLAENARNAALLPLTILPATIFLFWLKQGDRRSFTRTQNIAAGYWIVTSSALASYIATFLPENVTTAIISTTVGNILLWLLVVQLTRKLYQSNRQANIAQASQSPIDDPDVKRLANNTDLATATVLATFITAKCTILIDNEVTPFIFKEAVAVIAMNIGAIVGFLWFNFCPNQSEIREFIAAATRGGAAAESSDPDAEEPSESGQVCSDDE